MPKSQKKQNIQKKKKYITLKRQKKKKKKKQARPYTSPTLKLSKIENWRKLATQNQQYYITIKVANGTKNDWIE